MWSRPLDASVDAGEIESLFNQIVDGELSQGQQFYKVDAPPILPGLLNLGSILPKLCRLYSRPVELSKDFVQKTRRVRLL